ncbi:MAG TPA: hypothetical protein VEK79_14765, partial [Thermoanaerobaculia bacterium]|nr:hypothetical protein [Thermoanaerobaculia bacterium]
MTAYRKLAWSLTIALIAALIPSPVAHGYACSEPKLTGSVDEMQENGSFTLTVERTDLDFPPKFELFFRGGSWFYQSLPSRRVYIPMSAACMAEPSELRVEAHDCWGPYPAGDWSTIISNKATKPSVHATTEKAFDPVAGRMRRKATIKWDFGLGTSGWTARADLLSWKTADGSSTGSTPLWVPTSHTRTGSASVFFDPPPSSQQFLVHARVQSCTGIATAETSIDCAMCDETASKDPVSYSDGNVQVYDADALPPIAGR